MTPTDEQWRPIPEWEGFYEASNLGRIRSVERTVYAGRGRYRVNPSRVLARQMHNAQDERACVKLSRDGRVTTKRVASLVLTAFVGPRPDGMEACHLDGDCTNDRLDNLRWDTRTGNRLDAIRHRTDVNARKTKCPRDHDLQAPNLVPSDLADGRRSCLACSRARSSARHYRKRGLPFDFVAEANRHYALILGAAE